MSTCSIMGQAVGTAAAIALKSSLSPRGVYENKKAFNGEIINLIDSAKSNFYSDFSAAQIEQTIQFGIRRTLL